GLRAALQWRTCGIRSSALPQQRPVASGRGSCAGTMDWLEDERDREPSGWQSSVADDEAEQLVVCAWGRRLPASGGDRVHDPVAARCRESVWIGGLAHCRLRCRATGHVQRAVSGAAAADRAMVDIWLDFGESHAALVCSSFHGGWKHDHFRYRGWRAW